MIKEPPTNSHRKIKSQKRKIILKSDEKIQQEKELDFSLLDGLPIGLYRSSISGRILDANNTLVEMFAYPDKESLLKTNAVDLYLKSADRKQWQALMDNDGVVQNFEVQMKTRDGKCIWIEDDARAIHYKNGQVLCYEGSLRDITQRKHTEQELRKSEERFRSAMEYAAIGKALVAPDGRWLNVNRSLCNMLGYSEDELLNIDFQTVTHPADLESDLEYVRQMLAGEIETYQMEKRYIHKQGHTVWALLSVSLVHDSLGEPLYFISQVQDITDRMSLQKEIIRKTEVLEAINRVFQETLSSETDEDVAYVCITAAEKITNSKVGFIGELNEKGLFDTITFGDLKWSICKMPESKAIRLSRNMQLRGLWAQTIIKGKSQIVNDPASHPQRVGIPKGHPQLRSFLGVPLMYSEKTIGMNGLANKEGGYSDTDVEAIEALSVAFVEALRRKRAEIEIKKSLQEKNALLSEIHHRVKNNMNVIVGLLNLQSRKIEDLPSIIALQNCVKRIHSMALVHEKLYQSKDFTNINIRDYIETLVRELDYSYGRSEEIATSINVDEISIHIETAIPIGLIINELVTNAIKHAFAEDRKGNIEISLNQVRENLYELSVHDDGIGMPKGIDLENIDTLGLKLVHILTKQLNGTVNFKTEKGTTFRIRFKGKQQ